MLPRSAKTGPVKTAFRDKRYTIPVLSVDLFDKVYPTNLWSSGQFIIRDYAGGLEPGTTFSGAFTFEGHSSFGLFQAVVAKHDAERMMLGAKFEWISKPGTDLMVAQNSVEPGQSPIQRMSMRVTITQPTVNWSLSGMLLDQYYGDVESGTTIRGMIRVGKAQESGIFNASVVRNHRERKTLALKFAALPGMTFELLENAMKKS
jgi:hypothetical protein